tara:strand:+ start:230 stop:376 length:147 start_codon:yes stop_codon:yes gene_type:complete
MAAQRLLDCGRTFNFSETATMGAAERMNTLLLTQRVASLTTTTVLRNS